VSGTSKRPSDLEFFRLVGDAFNECIDGSGNQVGFVEGQPVGDLDGSQPDVDSWPNGGIHQQLIYG
jgi:hypothetical protein